MSTEPPAIDPTAGDRGGPGRVAGPVLVIPLSFVLTIAFYGVLRATGLSTDGSEAVAGLFGGTVIMALAFWLHSRLPPAARREVIAPRRPVAACILVGLGLAVVLRITAGIVVEVSRQLDPSLCDELDNLSQDVPTVFWHKLLLAIGLVVLAPIGEELLFRGLFLRSLAQRMAFPPAAVISGVVFAIVHPQYWTLWPLIIAIAIFGVVAAFVYRRMGYPATVAMHFFFNAAAAVLLFVDVNVDTESCT